MCTHLGIATADPEDLLFRSTSVPAIYLRPKQALDLLLGLRDGGFDRIVRGHDLTFWAEVAAFSLELLSDQRFVPSVFHRDGDRLEARWVPWLADTALAELLQHLGAVDADVGGLDVRCDRLDRWVEIERGLEMFIDASMREVLVR